MGRDDPQTIGLRYGKVQVTIGVGILVGVFWIVGEAVSIRSTVNQLASERDAVRDTLTRVDAAIPEIKSRLTRVENRIDHIRMGPTLDGG